MDGCYLNVKSKSVSWDSIGLPKKIPFKDGRKAEKRDDSLANCSLGYGLSHFSYENLSRLSPNWRAWWPYVLFPLGFQSYVIINWRYSANHETDILFWNPLSSTEKKSLLAISFLVHRNETFSKLSPRNILLFIILFPISLCLSDPAHDKETTKRWSNLWSDDVYRNSLR